MESHNQYITYSVLMSLYDKENPDYLRQSIDSILSQSIKTDDLVIIIDGPININLQSVLDSYASKYPFFHIVPLSENRGLGNALNVGVPLCKNELIARMDSDDIAESTRCEKELSYFNNHENISVVGTQIQEFKKNKGDMNSFIHYPLSSKQIRRYIKKRCPFGHPSVMFKKAAILKSGNYSPSMINQQDYELWIRVLYNGFEGANIDESLLNLRIGDSLYKRRGGLKYFKLCMAIKKSLRKHKMISIFRYCGAAVERFIIHVLTPTKMREFIYTKFLRKHKKTKSN